MFRAGRDWQVWAEYGSSGCHPVGKAAQGVPEHAFLVPLPCSPRISALSTLPPAWSTLFSGDAIPVGPQVSPGSRQPQGSPAWGFRGSAGLGSPAEQVGWGL